MSGERGFPVKNLQVNNFMNSSFPYSQYEKTQNCISELPPSSDPPISKKKIFIPFSRKTQKSRRLQNEVKIIEVAKKKRKITKKEIKNMIDRNIQWKKKKETKLYHQKIKREIEEKQQ
jgi:hypothetical protein